MFITAVFYGFRICTREKAAGTDGRMESDYFFLALVIVGLLIRHAPAQECNLMGPLRIRG